MQLQIPETQKPALIIAILIFFAILTVGTQLAETQTTCQRLYNQNTSGEITILAINNNLNHTWITLQKTTLNYTNGEWKDENQNFTLPLNKETIAQIEEIGIN